MANVLYNYLTFIARDVIFFSGDVQTTSIAMAIAGSLCFSIMWAICHLVTSNSIPKTEVKRKSKMSTSQTQTKSSHTHRHSTRNSTSSEDDFNSLDISSKIDVPCVRCQENFADYTCRFVTCKYCCFCPENCFAHSTLSRRTCQPCFPTFGITEIDLRGRIDHCPKRIGFMGPQLTLLNLAQNNLTDLPPEIGCLRGLKELNLHKNKLTTVPDSIGSLVNLKVFIISHNILESLPDTLTSLSNIRHMDLGHNKISSLPHSITKLKKLRTLVLGHNMFKRIPVCLFELHRLKKLTFNNNEIESIPVEIENLYQLEILDLSHNVLEYIPESLCHCAHLKQIHLSYNRIQELPVKFGCLQHLYKLLLAKNCLKYLPCTLDLSKLNKINITGNAFLQESQYKPTPRLEHHTFPPLLEITFRYIASQKKLLQGIHCLPKSLQNQFVNIKHCSSCHSPVFSFFTDTVKFQPFQHGSLPYVARNCSPHLFNHSH